MLDEKGAAVSCHRLSFVKGQKMMDPPPRCRAPFITRARRWIEWVEDRFSTRWWHDDNPFRRRYFTLDLSSSSYTRHTKKYRLVNIMLSSLRISSSRALVKRSLLLAPRRNFSFSFAGARKLDEIVKKELLEDKTAAEVSDIWYSYHEERENVHGIILSGSEGKTVLSRAAEWWAAWEYMIDCIVEWIRGPIDCMYLFVYVLFTITHYYPLLLHTTHTVPFLCSPFFVTTVSSCSWVSFKNPVTFCWHI